MAKLINVAGIPIYPCDKELFPGAQLSPDDEREETKFFNDFKIAEPFGINAIKDTFNRAFESWKDSIKYITELCVVMNHLCWMHYEKGNGRISELYASYYHKCMNYVYAEENNDKFSDDDRLFFHNVLD